MYIETENKQVIAHLYRGEMNRLTVYRQRLDITTNWSIMVIVGILVIYLDKNIHLYFIFFPLLIILFFSFLEARRYRYFYTSCKRTQYLEQGFFGKQILLNDQYTNELIALTNNLIEPYYLISLQDAWIIRFYRNYIWLSYICLLITLYKFFMLEKSNEHNKIIISVLYIYYIFFHIYLHNKHIVIIDI